MSSNFTYFCFIVLSIGEESNQEAFAKRLKTHTVDKKEVKDGEIKKKKRLHCHCLCSDKNLLLRILHMYMTNKQQNTHTHIHK